MAIHLGYLLYVCLLVCLFIYLFFFADSSKIEVVLALNMFLYLTLETNPPYLLEFSCILRKLAFTYFICTVNCYFDCFFITFTVF